MVIDRTLQASLVRVKSAVGYVQDRLQKRRPAFRSDALHETPFKPGIDPALVDMASRLTIQMAQMPELRDPVLLSECLGEALISLTTSLKTAQQKGADLEQQLAGLGVEATTAKQQLAALQLSRQAMETAYATVIRELGLGINADGSVPDGREKGALLRIAELQAKATRSSSLVIADPDRVILKRSDGEDVHSQKFNNHAAGFSDVGITKERVTDEDCLGYQKLPDGTEIYALADGAGGHNAGEVAAQIAVEQYLDLRKQGHTIADTLFLTDQTIRQYTKAHPEAKGAMTTIAILEVDTAAKVARVVKFGDSRVKYVDFMTGKGTVLTKDGSLVMHGFESEDATRGAFTVVDQGQKWSKIMPDQDLDQFETYARAGHKNIIMEALGSPQSTLNLIDVMVIPLLDAPSGKPFFGFFLYCDGLNDAASETEITQEIMDAAIDKQGTPSGINHRLRRLAFKGDTTDNVSAITTLWPFMADLGRISIERYQIDQSAGGVKLLTTFNDGKALMAQLPPMPQPPRPAQPPVPPTLPAGPLSQTPPPPASTSQVQFFQAVTPTVTAQAAQASVKRFFSDTLKRTIKQNIVGEFAFFGDELDTLTTQRLLKAIEPAIESGNYRVAIHLAHGLDKAFLEANPKLITELEHTLRKSKYRFKNNAYVFLTGDGHLEIDYDKPAPGREDLFMEKP